MKYFWVWVFLALAVCFVRPALAAEEAGLIDSGGVITERQVEEGSVKGAFTGNSAGVGDERYWASVLGLIVLSLLVFEAGWYLGERSGRNPKP